MVASRERSIEAIAALAPVIPVLTIDRLADAVPLGRALVKGGLPVIEITLRTEAAMEAARQIASNVPGAVVGVGTVLTPAQMQQARNAGARFAVSPGCTAMLAQAAFQAGMPYLPRIQTVSEAMELSDKGYRLFKFFDGRPQPCFPGEPIDFVFMARGRVVVVEDGGVGLLRRCRRERVSVSSMSAQGRGPHRCASLPASPTAGYRDWR